MKKVKIDYKKVLEREIEILKKQKEELGDRIAYQVLYMFDRKTNPLKFTSSFNSIETKPSLYTEEEILNKHTAEFSELCFKLSALQIVFHGGSFNIENQMVCSPKPTPKKRKKVRK